MNFLKLYFALKAHLNKIKEEIPFKILKLNAAFTESELLSHLSTKYPDVECSGFFYNADQDVYCEFEFLYVPYEISGEIIHFGYCHIRGLHKSNYEADYTIDDEDGDTWYKTIKEN